MPQEEEKPSPLRAVYYFEQIKEEFRGNDILFMNLNEDCDKMELKRFRLGLKDLAWYIQDKLHSPLRTYIGVSDRAQLQLEKTFVKKGGVKDVSELDSQIVLEKLVQREDKVRELADSSVYHLVIKE